MKRFYSFMIVAAIAAMSFVSCKDDSGKEPEEGKDVAVTEVTVSPKTLAFTVGDAAQTLTATVKPENATEKTVTWTSSAPTVATVDNGVVTPVGEGVAVITATAGSVSGKCNVTVSAAAVAVTGVSLSSETLDLGIGSTEQLVAFVEPEDADNPIVEWESDNEAVATVDDAGNVKGVAAGEAVITVTTLDGAFTAECAVTVSAAVMELTADMITTSAPMQYSGFLKGYDHEDGMGGSPDWYAKFANEGGDAEQMFATREARYGLAENMWDGVLLTSFMTNMDYFDEGSWIAPSERSFAYHDINVNFDTPVKEIKIYIMNANKYAYFLNDNGFNVYISEDGEGYEKTAASPYYTEGGIADSNGANAECTIESIYDENGIRSIRFDANGHSMGGNDGEWTGNGAAFGIAELKIWRLQ